MPESKITMNPQIRTLEIGIRDLRTITLYPLSFRDQSKLKELVFEGLGRLTTVFTDLRQTESGELSDLSVLEVIQELSIFAIEFIERNIERFVKMVSPDEYESKDADLLSEMSLNQVITMAEIVYEVNYDFLSQTIQKLMTKFLKAPEPAKPQTILTRLGKESISTTLSPPSPEGTPTH